MSTGRASLHVFGSRSLEMLFLVFVALAALLMLFGDEGKNAARRQMSDWWSSLAGTPPLEQAPVRFSIGSAKETVLRVQGEPTEKTEKFWRYGRSKVYFIGDRVSGWKASPRDPLKTLPAAGE